MDAAILTTALSDNYGAALQTYALVKVVNKLGVEAVVYRYNNPHRIMNSMTKKQKVFHAVWSVVSLSLNKGVKRKRFKEFRKKFIPLSEQLMQSSEELKENFGDYDIYIAGSDQIWNPDFFVDDLSYYFDFLPNDKKRISYASSFGKAEFGNEKYREKCASLLRKFEHISVREQSGVTIIRDLCGVEAEWVLDPTLLLDESDWMELVNIKEKRDDIILCYTMPGDKIVTDSIEKVAKQISNETGLPIIRIGNKEYDVFKYGRKSCDITAGPIEFVKYFLKAKYIITNSFHGTAFGLNFGKHILIPLNDSIERNSALHERLISLLGLLGAENAIIKITDVKSSIDFQSHTFQQSAVEEKLVKERTKSYEYLKSAIGE